MNEQNLITYYNKFNEDKRLNTRHGKVEFITSIKYIEKYLKEFKNPSIIDIGAGTGKYSIYLADKEYDVTAVELIKHNLRLIEKKSSKVKAFVGNATDLFMFDNELFDITILFGPMYHLITKEEKIKALKEAKRITKKNGYIFIQYCMNEYAIIMHGFIDNNILDSVNKNKIDDSFHVKSNDTDLYSYVRLEEIDELNEIVGLKRINIINPDGPANYIRSSLNKLSEEEFELFIKYNLSICERKELLGSGYHILDIVKKI